MPPRTKRPQNLRATLPDGTVTTKSGEPRTSRTPGRKPRMTPEQAAEEKRKNDAARTRINYEVQGKMALLQNP